MNKQFMAATTILCSLSGWAARAQLHPILLQAGVRNTASLIDWGTSFQNTESVPDGVAPESDELTPKDSATNLSSMIRAHILETQFKVLVHCKTYKEWTFSVIEKQQPDQAKGLRIRGIIDHTLYESIATQKEVPPQELAAELTLGYVQYLLTVAQVNPSDISTASEFHSSVATIHAYYSQTRKLLAAVDMTDGMPRACIKK